MTDLAQATNHGRVRRSRRHVLPWTIAILSVLAISLLRASATGLDFAPAIDSGAVNVMTALLAVIAWIALVCGLRSGFSSSGPWLTGLLLPLLAGGIFLVFYRLERFDGALAPKFAWRWSSARMLPVVETKTTTSLDPSEPERVDPSSRVNHDGETSTTSKSSGGTPNTALPEFMRPRETDFPQFLGPNRNGMLPQVEVATDWEQHPPEVLWKQPIGEGWSSFAIQGDLAVTMEQRAYEEWVSAYDLRDGRMVWKYAIPARHSHVLGGVGPRSTPTIHENRVYACSAVSQVVCLDLADGQPLWKHELLELLGVSQGEFESNVAWGRSASPLVYQGRVIVPLGGVPGQSEMATLIAFDRESGDPLWRAGEDQISYASPVLANLQTANTKDADGDESLDDASAAAGNTAREAPGTNGSDDSPAAAALLQNQPGSQLQSQILIVSESQLLGIDPRTGEQLWSTPWPGKSDSSASVSQPVEVAPSCILLSKGYGSGCQLIELSVAPSGQWQVDVMWKNRTALKTKFTSVVFQDGYAYGLSDGILECINLEDGQRMWKRGRYQHGQLLLVGRHLLVTAESGELVLVSASPERFEELGSISVIGDVSWNTPALSGDRLLMRNSNEAACVRLPLVNDSELNP